MSAGVPEVVKCGFSDNAEMLINRFSDTADGSEFYIGDVKVSSSLPGEYNARNITLALALARVITGKTIAEASVEVKGIKAEGRFQHFDLNGVNVVVDYAHNSDSVREVATLAKRLFGGRIISVFGSVGERSVGRRRELAEAAEKYTDFSVITSDNSGIELPLSICADIYEGFADKTKAKIIVGRGDAISYAIGEAKVGDSVLILGRGHERFLNQGGKMLAFSDLDYVRSLKEKGSSFFA
jgi:UDP-N-acetylmuramoyl-L-alanyl-D-glutamate--2,6-diaminopimelate ligase